MQPNKYRKVATVEAMQVTGESRPDVVAWIQREAGVAMVTERGVAVSTLEGVIEYADGWWVLRNEPGEFYGIAADRFESTYVKENG